MCDVFIIGGGAAGMLTADIASKRGLSVVLAEKNNRLGRKVLITGKGRCNLTNASDVETLISNTMTNPYFMYSSFYSFDSNSVMEYFETLGVPLKVERGNRVFPVSDKANDIVTALEKSLKTNGVKVLLNTKVTEVLTENNKISEVKTSKGDFKAKSVVIATGGMSYPLTGSTGDGYKFARSVGHTVTKLLPSLVPLKTEEKWCKDLQGLSLKNVEINVIFEGKSIWREFGEMLFTHFGVSGPLILTAGSKLCRLTDGFSKKSEIIIDLKPAMTEKELDNRLLRDFEKNINKNFNNSLNNLLPQKLIPVIINLSGIDQYKKVNTITKEERKKLVSILKGLKITIIGTTGFNEAIITSGGVCVDEIDPSTMESKITKGLFFAGEVIDVDGVTGGFNLQIAFSTAFLAGSNV